jgi:hypothetical protein
MKPAHKTSIQPIKQQSTDKWNESKYIYIYIRLSKPPHSCIGYLFTHIIKQLLIEIVKRPERGRGFRGRYSGQERESCWI